MPTTKDRQQVKAKRQGVSNRQKSVAKVKSGAGYNKGGKYAEFDAMTRTQLYDRAKELNIDGRSKMNKDELVKAISKNKK